MQIVYAKWYSGRGVWSGLGFGRWFISAATRLRVRRMATDMVVLQHAEVENGCCNKGPGYASPLQAMSGPNEALIYVTCIYTGNISTFFFDSIYWVQFLDIQFDVQFFWTFSFLPVEWSVCFFL